MIDLSEATQSPRIPSSSSLEQDIIAYCRSPHSRQIAPHKILALDDHTVVKYGRWVWEEEFLNQKYAFDHLERSKVWVPEPLRYFRHDNIGYFLMELLPDCRECQMADIDAVAQAVEAIHDLPLPANTCPGPVNGGIYTGNMGEDKRWTSKSQFELYLNSRISHIDERFSIEQEPLSFVHLDIAPRNVYRNTRGTICIIDWEMAGFFLRYAEYAVLEDISDTLPASNAFKARLSETLKARRPLEPSEWKHKELLKLVMWENLTVGQREGPWDAKRPETEVTEAISMSHSEQQPQAARSRKISTHDITRLICKPNALLVDFEDLPGLSPR